MSDNSPAVVTKKRGRPSKALLDSKKNRGKVGRPPGDAARIQEFKARLLSTAGDSVISKVVQIAKQDDHPGQMAALKMCLDRLLPLSLFEKDARGGSRAVTINITGVGATTIVPEPETFDMEEENAGT